MAEEGKRCSRCKESKPKGQFPKSSSSTDGLHGYCRPCSAVKSKEWRDANKERHDDNHRRWRLALKLEVLAAYGSVCSCCGEFDHRFLTFYHVDGGGRKHRDSLNIGGHLINWLKNNDYPLGFQVLCWNCNCARHINGGVCPHQETDGIDT